jgi:hypothetical protein
MEGVMVLDHDLALIHSDVFWRRNLDEGVLDFLA